MEETLMRHSSSRKPLAFEELKCQGVGSNEPYSDKPENSEEKKNKRRRNSCIEFQKMQSTKYSTESKTKVEPD